jgi:hypothetical protein
MCLNQGFTPPSFFASSFVAFDLSSFSFSANNFYANIVIKYTLKIKLYVVYLVCHH